MCLQQAKRARVRTGALLANLRNNNGVRVVKTSKNTKHVYKINFAIAVNIYRAYLKHDGNETETMLLIQKYLTPVRYNRKYPIHLRPKRNRDFMYRVA